MLLNNRFDIIEQLGQGGFGTTYLAADTHMPSQRQCVVKQLLPETPNQQSYNMALKKFKEEAEVLEQLNHPQIPKLYGYFEQDGQFYLIQEWIQGQTLGTRVRHNGPLPETEVMKIMQQLLPVLDYLHHNTPKEVIHRDVKPDNIILRQLDQQPVLIDFGAVKQLLKTVVSSSGSVTCSVVIGSGGFMPPEQAAQRVVYSSDLYSLGMTAIYALTGKLPEEIPVDPHTSQPLWQQYAPGVSDAIATVINRVTQLQPRDRYTTAHEMLMALNVAANASPTLVTPVAAPMSPTVMEPPPQQPTVTTGSHPIPVGPFSGGMPSGGVPSAGGVPSGEVPVPTQVDATGRVISTGGVPNGAPPMTVVPAQGQVYPPNSQPYPTGGQPYSGGQYSQQPYPTGGHPGPQANYPWQSKVGLAAAGLVAIFAASAGGAFMVSLASNSSGDSGQLNKVEALAQEKDYEACQDKADNFGRGSDYYDEAQALLNQCRLGEAQSLAMQGRYGDAIAKANEVPKSDKDSHAQAQDTVEVLKILEDAEKLEQKGRAREAIDKVLLTIDQNSSGADVAWEKVAAWSQVKLRESMDKQVEPLNLPKPVRNLANIGVSSIKDVAPKTQNTPIKTKFGSSPVETLISNPKRPAHRKPSSAEEAFDEKSWSDPWRETYSLASDKMSLTFMYGCTTHIVVHTETAFDASMPLGLMEAQLASMVAGTPNADTLKMLKDAHAGKLQNADYKTGDVQGVIQRTANNQILITARKAV